MGSGLEILVLWLADSPMLSLFFVSRGNFGDILGREGGWRGRSSESKFSFITPHNYYRKQ